MCGRDTSSEERERGAAVFAKLLYQTVKSKSGVPGRWREEEFNRNAIDEGCSDSIIEFRMANWPPRYRLSIHSDDGGSLVGYGVFRPSNMNRRSDDPGLPAFLAARVSGGRPTPRHWAWYREVEEPLCDFSRPATLIEVEKIRRGEKSKGDDAFQRASGYLAALAEALDSWYSECSRMVR